MARSSTTTVALPGHWRCAAQAVLRRYTSSCRRRSTSSNGLCWRHFLQAQNFGSVLRANQRHALYASGLLRRLTLHSSHPAGRFLDTLLHVLKGHAWSQHELDVRALIEGLTNHWNFRRVRQVEDRKECALSVLNKAVEGFRLEGFLDPIQRLCCRAAAEDFVSGFSVEDNFQQHPHDNLQMSRAGVRSRGLNLLESSRRSTPAGRC